jgi:hypothetical protein
VRICAKPRCGSRAAVSVALRYDDREVLVGELSGEPDPGLVDLCAEHAERLTAPRGWRMLDLRAREPLRA